MASVKIRVPIEVVVDVEGWNDEYQNDETPAAIRTSIQQNVLLATQDAFSHLDCVKVREA